MNFENLLHEGFEVGDGRFFLNPEEVHVSRFKNLVGTVNEYKIAGDYDVTNNYRMDTDAYSDWYVKRVYAIGCKIKYFEGENWMSN